jgi:hypothetical protein
LQSRIEDAATSLRGLPEKSGATVAPFGAMQKFLARRLRQPARPCDL